MTSKARFATRQISTFSRNSHFFDRDLYVKPTEREKVIQNFRSVASIEHTSRELLHDVTTSKSSRVPLIRIERLVSYLKNHRIARKSVSDDHGIQHILKLYHSSKNPDVHEQARVALALLGHVEPVKGRGIRVLSLDGGGTRGIMTIEMLKEITDRCDQPVHELFDLIIGTSTGAILAVLLGVQKYSLAKCEALYEKLSREIFTARKIKGTARLLVNQSYYDTAGLENILKEEFGDTGEVREMIDYAAFPGPKVAVVSTLMNYEQVKSFVFRTYHLPREKDDKSFYKGTSKYQFWQAIRASTAAPGYFEEIQLDHRIHQDGGFLNNNPTAVAIHEAKILWPTTPFQAVVSLGTGTYHGSHGRYKRTIPTVGFTSRREKLKKLVYSATDVEVTHEILKDLLPATHYVRLNPNMSKNLPLDVSGPADLEMLRKDTRNYVDKFEHKFEGCARMLLKEKTFVGRIEDEVRLMGSINMPRFVKW